MVDITFTIEGDEHTVEINPEMGHPREVYKEGGAKVADYVSDLGYEFIGDSPDYQKMSRAHRNSGDAEVVCLGDITDEIREVQDDSAEEGVSVKLTGPDGHSIERSFRPNQTLTQVKADLVSYHGIDREKTVSLFNTTSKSDPINQDESVEAYDNSELYWDIQDR